MKVKENKSIKSRGKMQLWGNELYFTCLVNKCFRVIKFALPIHTQTILTGEVKGLVLIQKVKQRETSPLGQIWGKIWQFLPRKHKPKHSADLSEWTSCSL